MMQTNVKVVTIDMYCTFKYTLTQMQAQ